MAVSSESSSHKELRYEVMSQLVAQDDAVTIHDVGAGLGDYFDFLQRRFPEKTVTYSGSEIVREFHEAASRRYPAAQFFLRDLAEGAGPDRYDYLVLSGVFHQRRETTIPEWERFSQALLRNSFPMAKKGIGFNFISPFVDFYQTEVYYCNVWKLIQFIVDELSRFFVIHHNYALYEFTVFVFRPEYIEAAYDQPEFQKYFPGSA